MNSDTGHTVSAKVTQQPEFEGAVVRNTEMTAERHADWLQSFTARIEKIASDKLGTPVTVARWDTLKTGAKQPIFSVPESHREQAAALGLALV